MKKLVVIILIVCLLFAGAISYLSWDKNVPVQQPGAEQPVQEGEELKVRSLNAEKLYAAYAPDYVVMTVNGQDILWKDYFYFINANADTVSSYLLNAQAYGVDVDWEDELAEGETYIDYVTDYSDDVIRQMVAIEGFASENGAGISVENQQALDAETESTKLAVCGEGASDEDFDAYLAQQYLSREFYERIGRVNYLYQNSFTAVYGENGAFVSDEDAINYLQTGGYMYVNHILYLTTDMNTGEELDAETVENKLAGAQQMSEYLRTLEVEDKAELAARFAELKAQECEDSGKAAYPNGYVFLPGTMVPEFESASEALGEYEVSEPVKSSYGYHVIIRLPLDPDAVVEYSNEGTPLTGRSLYANQQFGIEMQNYHDSMEIVKSPDFENFSIAAYLE